LKEITWHIEGIGKNILPFLNFFTNIESVFLKDTNYDGRLKAK